MSKICRLRSSVPWAIPEGETITVFKPVFIAEVIRWGMRQNPFAGALPRKAKVVVEKLQTLLPDFIETGDMLAYVSSIIEQVPEIRDWNLSQVELECGVTVDDPTRPPFAFESLYFQTKPEYDFIDLSALAQNIARSLVEEYASYRTRRRKRA